MYKIVIFASNEIDFLIRKNEISSLSAGVVDCIWCNSSTQTRGLIIESHSNKWLLFIDQDCIVNRDLLAHVNSLIKSSDNKKNVVYTGRYNSPAGSSYFQKAHNFIANTWYEQSYLVKNQAHLLLGGIFLIHSVQSYKNLNSLIFWGAEDKSLSYDLLDLGFEFINAENLVVDHYTSCRISHFFKRAYAHGKNEILHIGKNRNSINYFFWIRKIGFANANLLPLILLHFCIQRVARLIQTILQLNKQ